MKSTIRIVIASTTMILGLNSAEAQDVFKVHRDIIGVTELSQETVAAIDLDADCFRYSLGNFADVRLLDGDGNAAPHVLSKVTTTRKILAEEPCALNQTNFKIHDDSRIEVMFRRPESTPVPRMLRIKTPLSNFEKWVTIEGSQDQKQWVTLVETQPIYDYSRFMDVRNTTLTFPATPCTFYRITIDNITDVLTSPMKTFRKTLGENGASEEYTSALERREFRIEELTFFAYTEHDAGNHECLTEVPTAAFSVVPRDGGRETLVTLDTGREPLCGFQLQIDDTNVQRRVDVQVYDPLPGHDPWRFLASGTITKLTFRTMRRDEDTVRFPETRAERFRLVIHNGDAPALGVSAVTGLAVQYRLHWLAYPGKTYSLAYGAPRAKTPVYTDDVILRRLIAHSTPKLLTLGPPVANPADVQHIGNLLNRRWLLWTAFAVMVAALGWGIVVALKRVEAQSDE